MADLITVAEAALRIRSGQLLMIAGEEALLAELPAGSWIGGTTPYFMAPSGGRADTKRVFVTELSGPVRGGTINVYAHDELESIPNDYARQGCSFIILPTGSATHFRFANCASSLPGLFNCPLVGWNAGVMLNSESRSPRVFDGRTRRCLDDAAVVLHAELAEDYVARIDIVNPFQQGQGPKIAFPRSGFTVTECWVDGREQSFCEFLAKHQADTRWPLVADYAGAAINVSFRNIDRENNTVHLYAPVFEGVEYRLAEPVADLAEVLAREFNERREQPAFTCNCVLNYLYAELEGKSTGEAAGPITFGEVAYMQLNQTLVYVTFDRAA
ncbi:MAG TPA: hypothetical protein VFQ61_12815 [Polyangiaceae bacterium]|nr:hypothetical protein [Polyangiaceae bacterium]